MNTIRFGDTLVTVHDFGTVITFADGLQVDGNPEDTDPYRATAARYGYGSDTLALCKDHEIMHIALAHWLRIESPTMRQRDDMDLRELEEAAVLAVQQYARAAGVDLIQRFTTDEPHRRPPRHPPDPSRSVS